MIKALPVTARRAKRENGGLGEVPPGSTMTYLLIGPSDLDVQSRHATSFWGLSAARTVQQAFCDTVAVLDFCTAVVLSQ